MRIEEKENGHRAKIEIEIYADGPNDFYVEVLDPANPWLVGKFNSLDNALRYVYFEFDDPKGTVEIVNVCMPLYTASEFILTLEEQPKDNNVIPIRKENDKDK